MHACMQRRLSQASVCRWHALLWVAAHHDGIRQLEKCLYDYRVLVTKLWLWLAHLRCKRRLDRIHPAARRRGPDIAHGNCAGAYPVLQEASTVESTHRGALDLASTPLENACMEFVEYRNLCESLVLCSTRLPAARGPSKALDQRHRSWTRTNSMRCSSDAPQHKHIIHCSSNDSQIFIQECQFCPPNGSSSKRQLQRW